MCMCVYEKCSKYVCACESAAFINIYLRYGIIYIYIYDMDI